MRLFLRSSFLQSHASKKQRDGERAMALRITTARRMMMMMILPPVFLQLLSLLLLMLSTFRCCSSSVTCYLPVPCFLPPPPSPFFFLSFGLFFFRGFVLSGFCSSSWIGIRTASFWWEGFVDTFFVPTVCFDQKSEDIARTARALFFLISRIFVFLSSLNYESWTLLALEIPGARKSLSYNTMCMKAILASRCNDE
jgi:hypothetical protein